MKEHETNPELPSVYTTLERKAAWFSEWHEKLLQGHGIDANVLEDLCYGRLTRQVGTMTIKPAAEVVLAGVTYDVEASHGSDFISFLAEKDPKTGFDAAILEEVNRARFTYKSGYTGAKQPHKFTFTYRGESCTDLRSAKFDWNIHANPDNWIEEIYFNMNGQIENIEILRSLNTRKFENLSRSVQTESAYFVFNHLGNELIGWTTNIGESYGKSAGGKSYLHYNEGRLVGFAEAPKAPSYTAMPEDLLGQTGYLPMVLDPRPYIDGLFRRFSPNGPLMETLR